MKDSAGSFHGLRRKAPFHFIPRWNFQSKDEAGGKVSVYATGGDAETSGSSHLCLGGRLAGEAATRVDKIAVAATVVVTATALHHCDGGCKGNSDGVAAIAGPTPTVSTLTHSPALVHQRKVSVANVIASSSPVTTVAGLYSSNHTCPVADAIKRGSGNCTW